MNIYISDFREVLFEELPVYFEETTQGGERAFEHTMGSGFTLLILTSITEGEQRVREDNDAIRVLLKYDNEIVDGQPHTKRTEGFQRRLTEKINRYIKCPECHNELKIAEGEYGFYYFCTEGCGYTESLVLD